MQIILSKEECETIHESLLTEKAEAMRDYKADEIRGRDLKYADKRLQGVNNLLKRFFPYVEN